LDSAFGNSINEICSTYTSRNKQEGILPPQPWFTPILGPPTEWFTSKDPPYAKSVVEESLGTRDCQCPCFPTYITLPAFQQSPSGDHHYPDGLPFSLRCLLPPIAVQRSLVFTLPFISLPASALLGSGREEVSLLGMLYKFWGQERMSKSCSSQVSMGLVWT